MQAQCSVNVACFELSVFLLESHLLANLNTNLGHTTLNQILSLSLSLNLNNVHVQMVTGNYGESYF